MFIISRSPRLMDSRKSHNPIGGGGGALKREGETKLSSRGRIPAGKSFYRSTL